MTDAESKSTKSLDGGYITNIHNNSQDSAIGTVPVVYMPMSPISVVSPVQVSTSSVIYVTFSLSFIFSLCK